MASTPPTPNCSSIPARPSSSGNSSNSHHHRHRHHNSHIRNQRHGNNSNSRWNSTRYSNLAKPSPLPSSASATGAGSASGVGVGASDVAPSGSGTVPGFTSSLSSFIGARKSRLGPEFSGRRSTRFVGKMYSGRPRIIPNNVPHSSVADEALHCLVRAGNDSAIVDNVLLSFEDRMRDGEDYVYLIREFGNRDMFLQATRCYDFAMMRREYGWFVKGKLTSTLISTLGRMRKIEAAWSLFEVARSAGYGNTVYSFSSMISAFGHNGLFQEAVNLFRSMRTSGLEPNLVTYNALIDAGAKGQVEFSTVVKFFEEMVENGVRPDRVTYNSLLSVCVPRGLWEVARDLFNEMEYKGINRDLYTYNTFLDALCKGGQMDLARRVMADMPAKKVSPSVVTYSTVMDGYVKAGRYDDALVLYDEMRRLSVPCDRVSYNTLVTAFGKLGRFADALNICKEMEKCGFTKDVVTYNALLGGYGKHGMYDEVKRMFGEMKAKNIYPNTLTYSTMIDVYTKGGMYREAMEIYREFKQQGLEIDVVLYSSLIDALCKNRLVESAIMLLEVMTKKGIKPNVITYNSIIDAFGEVTALEWGVDASVQSNEHQTEPSSSSMVVAHNFHNQVRDEEDDQIIKMFEQLAVEKDGHLKKDKRSGQDNFSISWLFHKMHELEIKPNVVTFSAILNACSRCNSFEDASKLLDELRLFDNQKQVYGVAHGLLMGYGDNIWFQAQSLFNEIKRMDPSTASAFYNALSDMLWHFGQKRGAQLVVLDGRSRNVWNGDWSDSCLDLHLMSCGAACAMVHAWLLYIRSVVFEGCELPKLLSILTGWGKHSKVVGDGTLRKAVEALLNGIGAPFRIAECNLGRFVSPGYVLAAWLKQSSTLNVLVLQDHINSSEGAGQVYKLQALC